MVQPLIILIAQLLFYCFCKFCSGFEFCYLLCSNFNSSTCCGVNTLASSFLRY